MKRAWNWVPTAFFAEGAPFMIVSAVTAVLFKSIGMDNMRMAFWTGLMMLPWSIKPFWAPLLDLFSTKRKWILTCQLTMVAILAAAAFFITRESLTALLLGMFFLLAFTSATHDAAVDGFYMIVLDEHEQSFFAGIRSTFYRLATVSVQGGLVALAGALEMRGYPLRVGWSVALLIAAAVMCLIYIVHLFTLPQKECVPTSRPKNFIREFLQAFAAFLHLPGVLWLILFLLFFRIAEAQLGKIAGVFLIDSPEAGGLGMSLQFQGFLYGTVGVIALTIGGIAGGVIVSRYGLTRCVWPLVCAINVPDVVYVYLAAIRPESLWIIGSCVAVEQFGYGLGYTAFMMVMLAAAERSNRFKTSHFAIMTALAVLTLSLFGMASGYAQSRLGYLNFFWYVMLCTIPSFLVTIPILRHIPKNFGMAVKPD